MTDTTHEAFERTLAIDTAIRASAEGKKPRLPKQTGPVEALREGWNRRR